MDYSLVSDNNWVYLFAVIPRLPPLVESITISIIIFDDSDGSVFCPALQLQDWRGIALALEGMQNLSDITFTMENTRKHSTRNAPGTHRRLREILTGHLKGVSGVSVRFQSSEHKNSDWNR